jgi:hypothetical protein
VFVVVLVMLVVVGGTAAALLVRSRHEPLDDSPISSADRLRDSAVGAHESTSSSPASEVDEDTVDDDAAAARYRAPGERSTTSAFGPPALVPMVTVRHLDAPDPQAASGEDVVETSDGVTPDVWPTAVDDVVSALVERVRTSDDDVTSVLSEMVEQNLDTEQMEEVLTELVERDRSARAKHEELTLCGPDVPHRPGRLSAFGDMPEEHKRRVIIRVLCLLIARSEEHEPIGEIDDRPEYTVTLPDDPVEPPAEPTARDLWGESETDARDAHLPARRRRLARAPR